MQAPFSNVFCPLTILTVYNMIHSLRVFSRLKRIKRYCGDQDYPFMEHGYITDGNPNEFKTRIPPSQSSQNCMHKAKNGAEKSTDFACKNIVTAFRSFGTVRVGTDSSTEQTVAIKTIPKFQISQPDVMQSDFRILRSFDHPNIIKLYDVCEGPRHLHIITELCTGGELFDRIIARGHFSEADAATLIRKILNAVAHCHDRGICHRDLKPENCLFETNAEDADLKVIDFGLSCMDNSVTGENVMKIRVGSIYYVAPEVLKGRYDKSCDLWSIGVIVYILLCGYPPFYGDTDSDVFEAVISGKFEFDTAEWSAVSDAAKEFIRSLLVVNPTKRLTASDALRHPWLSGEAPLTQIGLSSEILLSPKRFTGHNKLKKAALEGMADQMT
uniref:Predicted protein putative n=1 Tax=Albugo laibachii Nc14 TaxID=890382 RepID=F0X0Q3_9STRA|nr:predicted protein putative [Albugo laibachii Nc14]|eukprot:CCA27347.1 predicted protein putative [Albugo laibachii Nc14]